MKLYTGMASAEKKEMIIRQIGEKGQGSTTVIVPEQYTLTTERDLIEGLNLPGLLHIEVTSFSRILNRLSDELFAKEKKAITPLGTHLLMGQELRRHKKHLNVFQKSASGIGFIRELSSLVDQFKREGISLDALKAFRESLSEEDPLALKLDDLILVMTGYEEKIKEKFLDEEQKVGAFLDWDHELDLFSKDRVFLLGFKGFSYYEIAMLKKMNSLTKSLVIDLSYRDQEPEIFAAIQGTIDRLVEEIPSTQLVPVYSKETPARALSLSLQSMDTPPVIDFPVTVYEGKNPYEEVEFIALSLLEKHRMGCPWSEMRVITPLLGERGELIKHVFEKHQIPVFIDAQKPMTTSKIASSVVSLLRTIMQNFSQASLIRFLKEYALPFEYEDLDQLENYIIEKGLQGNRLQEEWPIAYASWIKPLLTLKEEVKACDLIEDYVKVLIKALQSLSYPERVEKQVRHYEDSNLLEEAAFTAQIWNKLVGVISQLKEVSGQDPCGLEEFIAYLTLGFQDETVGVLPPAFERVVVGSIERTIHHQVSYLFLMSAEEGKIPADLQGGDLLSDSEKEQMISYGLALKNTGYFKGANEVYNLVTLISLIKDGLYMSYSLSDVNGATTRPSFYVDRLLEIVPKARRISTAMSLASVKDLYMSSPSTRQALLIEALRQLKEGKESLLRPEEIAAYPYEDLLSYLYYRNDPLPVEKPLDQVLSTSVTRLERYNECPFAYFVQYEVGPVERKKYEVTPIEIGNLYHELMEKGVKALSKGDLTLDRIPDFLDKTIEALTKEEAFEVFFAEEHSRYTLIKTKRVATRMLNYLGQSILASEFQPSAFEQVVHYQADLLSMEGKIDRIDETDHYFNVIDYKTGHKGFSFAKVLDGQDLQLALYLRAYQREKNSQPAGMFYCRVQDPLVERKIGEDPEEARSKLLGYSGLVIDKVDLVMKMDPALATGKSHLLDLSLKKDGNFKSGSKVLSEAAFDLLLSKAEDKAKEISRGIIQGDYKPRPLLDQGRKACDYCQYKGVCQFDVRLQGNAYREVNLPSERELIKGIEEEAHEMDK